MYSSTWSQVGCQVMLADQGDYAGRVPLCNSVFSISVKPSAGVVPRGPWQPPFVDERESSPHGFDSHTQHERQWEGTGSHSLSCGLSGSKRRSQWVWIKSGGKRRTLPRVAGITTIEGFPPRSKLTLTYIVQHVLFSRVWMHSVCDYTRGVEPM
jgi:hypothetical protein